MTKVVSFASGKGGVGKTSLVANLGSLMARQGKKTLLIDGDWSLGKLGILFGARPARNISHVIDGEVSLLEAIHPISKNLHLLSSPSGRVGFEELNETARQQLFYSMETLHQQYDMVLFDHSSGVHAGVLPFAAASHEHVIVTTAEPTSYTDAYAIMKLLSKRFHVREFQCVVTMSFHQPETERIMERFVDVAHAHLGVRVRLLRILPWEAKVSESIRRQKPLVELLPGSEFTARLQSLSDELSAMHTRPTHGLRFFYSESATSLQAR